jgi:hypothetical protein
MKAFLVAVLVAAGLSAAAYYGLNSIGWTASEKYKTDAVRLD